MRYWYLSQCRATKAHLSLRCWHQQNMDVDEDSVLNLELLTTTHPPPGLDTAVYAFIGCFCTYALSINISCACLLFQ